MSDTPWRRYDWNDIIQRVNALCESPDPGCPAIDPLDEVEPEHIWLVTDVEAVQDKLLEVCPDNEFTAEKEMWKQDIITEIEDAITLGWCNCTCDNAGGTIEQYVAAINQTECISNPSDSPPGSPGIIDSGWDVFVKIWEWGPKWDSYCDLKREVERLEAEVAALEGDAKAAKQAELDTKTDERDAKKAEADELHAQIEAKAAQSMTDGHYPPRSETFSYLTLLVSTPWSNTECGEIKGNDPTACRVLWAVRTRQTHTSRWSDEPMVGDWTYVAGGGYTPSGTPYVIYVRSYSGVNTYLCSAWGPFDDPCGMMGGCDGANNLVEVKFTQTFPEEP